MKNISNIKKVKIDSLKFGKPVLAMIYLKVVSLSILDFFRNQNISRPLRNCLKQIPFLTPFVAYLINIAMKQMKVLFI
nr:MAG TPA: hypothetical protein [Bacteriophage sp.]